MSRPGPDPLALVRIAATAAEVAARAELSKKALGLLRPEQSPREFVEALLRAGRYGEAVTFLAFGLPRREAVWWAGLFILWTGAGRLHADDARALQAVVRWVVEPSEPHRQEAARFDSPATAAGRLARAVKRTGGSMLPPQYPARPPGPMLAPRAVVAAISAAVLSGDAKALPQRQRQAVALGLHVARGRFLWQPAAQADSPTRPTTTGS